jgi:hypothetical protein
MLETFSFTIHDLTTLADVAGLVVLIVMTQSAALTWIDLYPMTCVLITSYDSYLR